MEHVEVDPLLTTAVRNLRSYLSKASFSSVVDKRAAENCVEVLASAATTPPSAPVGVEGLAAKWRAEADEIALNNWSCNSNSIRARADELERVLAQQPAALMNGKLVGWWNGILPDVTDRSPYNPSIRWGDDAENSGHDIPLYAGVNPSRVQQPAADPKLVFGLGEAKALVGTFGGSNTAMVVQHFPAGRVTGDDGEPLPGGLYAWCDECPEEGSVYLGPVDTETEGHDDAPQQPAAVDGESVVVPRWFMEKLAKDTRDIGMFEMSAAIRRVALAAQQGGDRHG